MEVMLLVAAAAYAVVNGLNDGGALAGVAMHGGRTRPWLTVAALTSSLVAVPLVVGAPVARTLASGLVDFDADTGGATLLVAVVVAVAVTGVSAAVRLPTSLTLATLGAFVGVGVGAGIGVTGGQVARVLLLAVAAPLVGAVVARVGMGLVRLPWLVRRGRAIVALRRWSFALMSLAYAANDGQKMIAVAVIASGAGAGTAGSPGLVLLLSLAAGFAVGAMVGLRRAGRTLGRGVLAARPTHLLIGELSSSLTVAATGAVGAPVSMTQTVAGALAGGGAAEGPGRIRWGIAARLVVAWVVTFPAAFALAAGLGMLTSKGSP